ncbi:MAG: nucleoside-triphosphatase [Candidatus Altiarchaeota archaeon]|nr:nucleoside-triphosphatase [Candidatus Altiarchaeota archaeon]
MKGNILLSGKPGCGKTTLIRKVLNEVDVIDSGGFYTQEIRKGGVRVGFKITTLDGREGVLSHVDYGGGFRVGKYFVNTQDIDEFAVGSILDSLSKGLIVIDEIGKMELFSREFGGAVLKALDTKRVFGSITLWKNPFVEGIKKRRDVKIFMVTSGNRNSLVEELVERIK